MIQYIYIWTNKRAWGTKLIGLRWMRDSKLVLDVEDSEVGANWAKRRRRLGDELRVLMHKGAEIFVKKMSEFELFAAHDDGKLITSFTLLSAVDMECKFI